MTIGDSFDFLESTATKLLELPGPPPIFLGLGLLLCQFFAAFDVAL